MKSPYSKTVGYQLLHAARLHRARAAQLLQEVGLFPGQEQVLTALVERDGRTMGDLAEQLRVRPPTASKTVGRLAAQGLVERRSGGGDGDGRLVKVFLTDAGRTRAQALDPLWARLEEEATADLDSKERRRLRKLLRRVGASLADSSGSTAVAEDEPAEEVELEE